MPRIDEIFKLIQEQGGSDLHIAAGAPPMLRVHGEISPIDGGALEPELVEELLTEIMGEAERAAFAEENSVDFSYDVPGVVRLRCNIFRQRNGLSGSFRLLPTSIKSLEQLGLPSQLVRFAEKNKGLVVVTGPPGTGKSTTQAAILDHINANQRKHIITIEDPIEFIHSNKRCLVNQREIGRHAPSFASALRAALREDPNVVLVGEMRDLETTELAVTAAQTGMLVFGTLHTPSAAQTVDRIIDAFPVEQQQQIRSMLGDSLQGVVAQRLLKQSDGQGRLPAVEIMFVTPAIASLIRDRKTFQIPSTMQTGRKDGMQLMDDVVAGLYKEGKVGLEDALSAVSSREVLERVSAPAASPAAAATRKAA